MSHPIVIAHHLIWTAYGWWLPNDPRGSMSHAIASDVVAQLGEVHLGRKRVQPASSTIRTFYERAADHLRYELSTFDQGCRAEIAVSFDEVSRLLRSAWRMSTATAGFQAEKYTCYACAIMPDHVHLILRKHKHTAEQMIENFQRASRSRLRIRALRDPDHPV